MVWAKLDDEILDNPKVSRAGPLGFALHVAAVTWCCRNLSDGFIPIGRVGSLLDFSCFGMSQHCSGKEPEMPAVDALDVADWLADCELWHKVPGGFQLHDFLEYNPSKEKVISERQRGSERKDKHRMLSVRDPALASRPPRPRQQRGAPEEPVLPRNGLASASGGPVPVPVPERDLKTPLPLVAPPTGPEPVTQVRAKPRKPETPCPPSEASAETVAAWASGWRVPADHPEFSGWLDHHRKSDARWRDWAAAWRTWLKNASRFGQRQFANAIVQSGDNRAWKLPENF